MAVISMGKEEHTLDVALQKARDGKALRKWVNGKIPGASVAVLTDSTLCYDVPRNKRVIITGFWAALNTGGDSCQFNLVICGETAGGGPNTDISGHMDISSETSLAGPERDYRVLDPPICVKYSGGTRSISILVHANDASTEIGCGWSGWIENDND